MNFIDQYYHTKTDPVHRDTFRQIHIDVPRMNPDIPLFQQILVQEVIIVYDHTHACIN